MCLREVNDDAEEDRVLLALLAQRASQNCLLSSRLQKLRDAVAESAAAAAGAINSSFDSAEAAVQGVMRSRRSGMLFAVGHITERQQSLLEQVGLARERGVALWRFEGGAWRAVSGRSLPRAPSQLKPPLSPAHPPCSRRSSSGSPCTPGW